MPCLPASQSVNLNWIERALPVFEQGVQKLCLSNGDYIQVDPRIKFLIETDDSYLSSMAPNVLSRIKIIFLPCGPQ